jgi:His-Xaa-Ser system protein HxsD
MDLLPWTSVVSDAEVRISFSLEVYGQAALERAAYWFTERCFVHLAPGPTKGQLEVRLVAKSGEENLKQLAGEFGNRALDEQLRQRIADETRPIRELIVAQAFAEAELDESPARDDGRP